VNFELRNFGENEPYWNHIILQNATVVYQNGQMLVSLQGGDKFSVTTTGPYIEPHRNIVQRKIGLLVGDPIGEPFLILTVLRNGTYAFFIQIFWNSNLDPGKTYRGRDWRVVMLRDIDNISEEWNMLPIDRIILQHLIDHWVQGMTD